MPLVVVDNGPSKGERIKVEGNKTFIGGRDSALDISIQDPLVSRQHFRVRIVKGKFAVEDLGSANGTFVNGKRVGARSVRTVVDGDRIQVGETSLTFYEKDLLADPLVGRTISGFEVLEWIGSGGMGTVYKARQISLDRFVAVKVLSRELAENHKFSKLFHREARAAGQINHPSIVQVYDVDTVQVDGREVTFFAMEFMPGGSVEDLLSREKRLAVDRALKITLDTARGIQFAEKRGLVHRDIKPGNLMLGDGDVVKIGDLGIARRAESGSMVSQEGSISGSPHYISPEQAQGKDLDSRADIYSLGITLFHLLAGRPPFVGTSAKELMLQHIRGTPPRISDFRSDVPEGLVTVIDRMIRKDREERYRNGDTLVNALENVERSMHRATSAALPAKKWPSPKLKPLVSITVVLLLLVLVGSLGGVLVHEVLKSRQQRESDVKLLRDHLEGLFVEVEDSLIDGEIEQAQAIFEGEIQQILRMKDYTTDLADLAGKADSVRSLIEEEQEDARREERGREARESLQDILSGIPQGVDKLDSPGTLPQLIQKLESFESAYSGTEASHDAYRERLRLQSALKQIRKRMAEAREAYFLLENKVNTLISFDRPNYKEALRALRQFPELFAGMPESASCKEWAEEIEKKMEQAALDCVQTARESTTRGRRLEAIRQLESFRADVVGKALEIIDSALAELKK